MSNIEKLYKEKVLKPWLEGQTLEQIGKRFGFSREWIRIILKNKLQVNKHQKNKHILNRNKFLLNRNYLKVQKNMNLKNVRFGSRSPSGGNYWEKKVYRILLEKRFNVIIFGGNSLIDFIVNGYRVDVKGAFKPSLNKRKNGDSNTFQFRSRKKQRDYAEIFICCFNFNKKDFFYIIPSKDYLSEIISINPIGKDKYQKYFNAWKQLQY
jgi:hypothetical protein